MSTSKTRAKTLLGGVCMAALYVASLFVIGCFAEGHDHDRGHDHMEHHDEHHDEHL